jgi:para-aminobenzoate synthetase
MTTLTVTEVSAPPDPAAAFAALFGAHRAAFWLDSSRLVPGLSRFSILTAPTELVSYDVTTRTVTVTDAVGHVTTTHETLFDYLERELARRAVPETGLPFEFNLGYVGYFGYELKADCGGTSAHRSALPDGCFGFCDRALVIDHHANRAWLLALDTARHWLPEAHDALADLRPSIPDLPSASPVDCDFHHELDHNRELIADCLTEIGNGESYEICLTNSISAPLGADPWTAYQILRRVNPAPYAAYLALPGFSVLSSSPERFLRITPDREVESRPIKGTRRRGSTPAEDDRLAHELRTSEKDRAENVMIVDLVRNDLGRIAEPGSVHVPKLFAVESHPTVHQLVSTVGARLRPDVSPVACVRAAFPGGSMTGAPKLHTMEIIDRLENRPRGVYSGALGYLALNGAVDLSIVIRTMVVTGGRAEIGVGGAIVAQSDPDAEVDEIITKAGALLRVLAIAQQHAAGQPASSTSASFR